MQVIQGRSKGTVKIRQAPGGEDFNPPRFLSAGDTIEADQVQGQWLHLTKINGAAVVEEQWVSAGTKQQYVEWSWMTVPDPPPSSTHVVELFIDGVLEFRKVLGAAPPAPQTRLYQMGEDPQVLGEVRDCAAVMVLRDAPDTVFDRQWQFFLYAINPGMSPNAVSNLMDAGKALMNNTGINDPEHPRADYIQGEHLNEPPPRLDKLRTFARNIHAGVEVEGYLQLKTFDGNGPPPLKPGRTYPQTLAGVNLDDYLMTPQTHPEMFLVCNIVRIRPGGGTILFPFDNGGLYEWTPEPGEMYSFFPLVSRFQILSPLENWIQLAPGAPRPSYYRRGA